MKTPFRHPGAVHAALAVAALATAAATLLVVLAAFAGAASEPFLRDTPAARLAVARCDALGERGRRHACVHRLVAAAKASDAGAGRVGRLAPALSWWRGGRC
ncbi:MAG: hypothetical protein KJ023_11160 [Burkholderiaceae bacterium]|nr:hypothetical protein [Burkholderiaceae bacterium]